jgi:DNA-binding SARP family transcriptional activator
VNDATGGTITNLIPATGNGECALTPHLNVDYWTYREALHNNHTTTPHHRAQHTLAAITLHHAELGEDLTSTWIEPHRQDTIRETLDAATSLTQHLDTLDPDLILDALERARQLDPYNETTYQAIITTHIKTGRTNAATRTYTTLQKNSPKSTPHQHQKPADSSRQAREHTYLDAFSAGIPIPAEKVIRARQGRGLTHTPRWCNRHREHLARYSDSCCGLRSSMCHGEISCAANHAYARAGVASGSDISTGRSV